MLPTVYILLLSKKQERTLEKNDKKNNRICFFSLGVPAKSDAIIFLTQPPTKYQQRGLHEMESRDERRGKIATYHGESSAISSWISTGNEASISAPISSTFSSKKNYQKSLVKGLYR